MKSLDAKLLQKFLKRAGERLKGKWLLVGGTLLPAVGIDVRPTVDIDLVGLTEKESAQALELMEISESLGLSVESINQAAAFFVKKAQPRPRDLIPLHEGKSAVIYRPSVELFWKLKLARFSETDFLDCQHYLHFCRRQGDKIDLRALQKLVQLHLKDAGKEGRSSRLQQLFAMLT